MVQLASTQGRSGNHSVQCGVSGRIVELCRRCGAGFGSHCVALGTILHCHLRDLQQRAASCEPSGLSQSGQIRHNSSTAMTASGGPASYYSVPENVNPSEAVLKIKLRVAPVIATTALR